MEQELKLHLLRVAEAYTSARGISTPTVARQAAGDWRFFERLGDDAKTFTARKYDEVMDWFSANWPDDAIWPPEVSRPEPAEHQAAAS